MPNRILRDGINDSEAVNSLTDKAELFYRRLMSYADDFGRAPRNAALLRAKLFGLRLDSWSVDDIEESISRCETVGLLVSYETDGQKCLEIQKFGQRIREKSVSKFPDPPQSAALSREKPPLAARASTPTTHTTSTTATQATTRGRELAAAGYDSPEAFEAWWQELVGSHPNRNKSSVARSRVLEAVLAGNWSRDAFDVGYARLRGAVGDDWERERGKYCPNLYQIIADEQWKHSPIPLRKPPDRSLPPDEAAEIAEYEAAIRASAPEDLSEADRAWLKERERSA